MRAISFFLLAFAVVGAALPLGLWLEEREDAACDFSFVMCADAPCCMVVASERIEGQNASALRARLEAGLGCSVEGTLLSERYLELLCDPSIAYDPDMLRMPTRVRALPTYYYGR